ncbi:hypothetical protein NYR55_12110 [Sphingomonas sp. BGYR3]|uniref:hypothetical protein n=1 Tax=Sphingomonas sp. BGYR3 TaxID=2975483 RepID=UPI0021A4F03E|nr:hypothetical protein [Sphingomonas sp. BGYR3]MDG5489360.1 hypothetical protein [Sphingomonas sp. BGYR3]
MTLAEPKRILRWHLIVIGVIATVHTLVIIAAAAGHMNLYGLSRQFNLSEESNIVTTIAAGALVLGGVGAMLVSRLEARPAWRRGWLGASLCLFFMGLDEAAQVHELFSTISLAWLTGRDQTQNWVAIYLLILFAAGVYFINFWLSLPPGIKSGLALGGGIFVTSAVGLEIVEALLLRTYGVELYYQWAGQFQLFVEEVGEMVGVAIINYTVARRLHALTPDGMTLQWGN